MLRYRVFHKREFAELFGKPLINRAWFNWAHVHRPWKNVQDGKSADDRDHSDLCRSARMKSLLDPIEKTNQAGGGQKPYREFNKKSEARPGTKIIKARKLAQQSAWRKNRGQSDIIRRAAQRRWVSKVNSGAEGKKKTAQRHRDERDYQSAPAMENACHGQEQRARAEIELPF